MEHVNPVTLRDVLLILMSLVLTAGGVLKIVQGVGRQKRDVRLEDSAASESQVEALSIRTRDELNMIRADIRTIDGRLHQVERDLREMPNQIVVLLRNTGVIK